MYIINMDEAGISEEKLFKTKSGVIAVWLMESCKVPLLGKDRENNFIFMRTEELNNYLKVLPFWFDVSGIFLEV